MENRFENFTILIIQLSKMIQKIKNAEMKEFGLKAVHVMCIYFLSQNPAGLTNAEITKLTFEDKAAISRALLLLKKKGYVSCDEKTYNCKVLLTKEGNEFAKIIEEKAHAAVEAGSKGLPLEEKESFYAQLSLIAKNLKQYYDELLD